MPSQNTNIIKNLRAKHEPHQKLASNVEGLEKELVIQVVQLHKTLSKSFGMQRKTLMRVLALEKKVAELRQEKQPPEQDIGDWADESAEWDRSGGASSTAEEGGETTTQTPTATATKISANSLKKGTSQESVEERLARLESNRKDAAAAEEYKKTDEYKESITATDEEGDYLSGAERKARFKKTKITGADIKKGSSVEGAENVASEQAAMQKAAIEKAKIDIGTKYEGSPADDVTPTDAEAEKGGALAKGTESLIGPLKTIDSGVNSIVETLKQSNKESADAQRDARKAAEKAKRKKAEGKLEAITGPIGKAAEKVLAPVKSIFEKIFGFLMTIFAGNIAMRLFDWFSDPSNGEKIGAIFKFLKDWWPVLVGSMLAFAPMLFGPAGFILGVVALLAWGIPKIIDAINWVKGLFGIGVDKEITALGKDSKKEAEDISKNIDEDLTKDTDKVLKDQTEPVPETSDTDKVLKDQTEPVPETSADGKEPPKELANVSQDSPPQGELPPGPPPEGMNRGGIVPGSGPNRDTVPAMLTPGEFVMSKGAVEQYGANTLAGMNAAAGGTNRPTMGGYKSGGTVNNMSKNSVQNVKGGSRYTTNSQNVGGPRIHYNGGGQIIKPRTPVQYLNNGGKVMNLPGLGGGGGGTDSLTEQAKVYTKKDQGFFGKIRGGLDMLTGNRWDFDRQDVVKNTKADANRTGLENYAKIAKSSLKSASINPPSTPTTEVIVDQGVASQVQAAGNSMPNMDLPYFSASAMVSESKIRTLGITV